MGLSESDATRLRRLAEAWHVAGFSEGVADAMDADDAATKIAESAAARHDFEQALEIFANHKPTELELDMKAKRRTSKRQGGSLVTLARPQLVRVSLSHDGETLEVYSEQSMILSMPTGNVVQIKLRSLAEVD